MDVAELWVLFNYVFVPGSTGFMLKLMFWGSGPFALVFDCLPSFWSCFDRLPSFCPRGAGFPSFVPAALAFALAGPFFVFSPVVFIFALVSPSFLKKSKRGKNEGKWSRFDFSDINL